jgi:hypothetical protein
MPVPLYPNRADGAAFYAFAIVPSDSAAVAAPKGIYVGGAGNITLRCASSQADVVFMGVPVGTVLHLNVAYLRATGTTATNLVGLA